MRATVLCAIAVPIVWWILVLPARWDAVAVHVLARIVALSALFWGFTAWILAGSRIRLGSGKAVAVGLASPLACAALAVFLGVPLFPIEMMIGFTWDWVHSGIACPPTTTIGVGCVIAAGTGLMPLAIFPVGAGMGLLVGCVICRPRR